MRLMTWKLHRAFPELDRFSDEQCYRFIKATGRSWRRIPHTLLVLLTGVAGFVGGAAGAVYAAVLFTEKVLGRNASGDPPPGVLVLMFVVATVTGVVPAFLCRDWLLRTRVRRVLRTRSHCISCRYSLLGMPVDDACRVVCPECGTPTEVDPALGELRLGDAGERRFTPGASPYKSWMSEKSARRIKRTLLAAAVFFFAGLPALWGCYELWLSHQARVAQSERPQEDAFNALVEQNQPPGSELGANAWDVMLAVQTKIMQANAAKPAPEGPDGEWRADFTQVYAPTDPKNYGPANTVEEAVEELTKQREFAVARLGHYRDASVFDMMDEMAASPRAVRLISFRTTEPCLNVLLPELGQMRNMARMNAARMHLALEAQDDAEFLRALEANLALARICRSQVFLIDTLVGIAIESLTLDRLQHALKAHPSPEMLAKITAVLDRQRFETDGVRMLEGERTASLNNVGWVFTNKKSVRLGRYSRANEFSDGDTKTPVGTWVQNRDQLNAWFNWAEGQIVQPPHARSSAGEPPLTLKFVSIMVPAVGKAVQSYDTARLNVAGVRTMLALESYRAANDRYPASLDELVPKHLAAVPVDPWSGKPLKYRILQGDEVSGLSGWGYVLYSVAGDGQDDHGAFLGKDRQYGILRNPPAPPSESRGGSCDFIINHE